MEIWAYCRVSTKEQAYEDDALITQINRCKLYGATRIFYDVDRRTKDIRPGLKTLLEEIKQVKSGEISELVFTRLDRLAALPVTFYTLLKELSKKGITPIALDDNLDVNSVGGELSTDIRLAVSKHEVNMLSLRIRKVNEYKRSKGIPHNKMPFGYVMVNDDYAYDYRPVLCHLVERKEYSVYDLVNLIFETFDKTQSLRGTTKHLTNHFGLIYKPDRKQTISNNVFTNKDDIKLPPKKNIGKRYPNCTLRFTHTMLRYMFNNRAYSGNRGTKFEHDKIYISEVDQNKLLDIIKGNKCNPKSNRVLNKNPFTGKLICGECNSKYYRTFNSRRDEYFFCRGYKTEGICKQGKIIAVSKLERLFTEQIESSLETIANRIKDLENETDEKKPDKVNELERQIESLKSISPSNPVIEDAISSLQKTRDFEIANHLDGREYKSELANRFLKAATNLNFKWWVDIDYQAKRLFLDNFVNHIIINPVGDDFKNRSITIIWNF